MRIVALVFLLGCDVRGEAPRPAPPRVPHAAVMPRSATIPILALRREKREEPIDPWNAPPPVQAESPPEMVPPSPEVPDETPAEALEREARRYERMAHLRDKLDLDHDGKVTAEDVEGNDEHRHRFGEPSTIDLDGDGDLSVDELLTSRAAKRAARWY